MKPEAALSRSRSYSHTANGPVNMGGASLSLSMLVSQSGLQLRMFTTFMSFFYPELFSALVGFRNWAEEKFMKCKSMCYPFPIHLV